MSDRSQFQVFVGDLPLEELVALINSQFFTSLLGALAGAFAGAFAASKIATRIGEKKDLEHKIHATNSAITYGFMVANTLFSLKKQHILPAYTKFMQDKKKFEDCLKSPPPLGVIHFDMDLETITKPVVPLMPLNRALYENLSLASKPVAFHSALISALSNLNEAIAFRQSKISHFKTLFPSIREIDRLKHFFGIPLDGGGVDREYASSLDGLLQYTNDSIFFCIGLCNELVSTGDSLRTQFLKIEKTCAVSINRPKFDTPEAIELTPSSADYEDWMRMFESKETTG